MSSELQLEEYQRLWGTHNLAFTQSWYWGELKRTSNEIVRTRVGDYPVTILIRAVPGLRFRFGYIPRGFNEQFFRNRKNLELLVQALTTLRLSHVSVDPEAKDDPSLRSVFENTGFVLSGRTIQPQRSNLIDLRQSEEELLGNMKSKFRQYVRKSTANGIIVTEDTSSQAVARFYHSMKSILNNRRFDFHNQAYFERIYESFEGTGMTHLLFATQNDQDMGAFFVINEGKVLRQLYGGANEEGLRNRAAHALTWESIRFAKAAGCETYDQWGVALKKDETTYEQSDSLYGISLFKAGFGGSDMQYLPQYTYIFSKRKYQQYRIALSMRKRLLKLRKVLR